MVTAASLAIVQHCGPPIAEQDQCAHMQSSDWTVEARSAITTCTASVNVDRAHGPTRAQPVGPDSHPHGHRPSRYPACGCPHVCVPHEDRIRGLELSAGGNPLVHAPLQHRLPQPWLERWSAGPVARLWHRRAEAVIGLGCSAAKLGSWPWNLLVPEGSG